MLNLANKCVIVYSFLLFFVNAATINGRSFIYCCSNIIFFISIGMCNTDDFVTTCYNFLSMSFLARRWPFNRFRNEPNHSCNHSWFPCRFFLFLSPSICSWTVALAFSRDRLHHNFLLHPYWASKKKRKDWDSNRRPLASCVDLLTNKPTRPRCPTSFLLYLPNKYA